MERNAPDTASQPHLLQPRPYQLEMLGESLRHNVIVAVGNYAMLFDVLIIADLLDGHGKWQDSRVSDITKEVLHSI